MILSPPPAYQAMQRAINRTPKLRVCPHCLIIVGEDCQCRFHGIVVPRCSAVANTDFSREKAESLALEWMQRAQMDFDAAKHYPRIEKELRAHAQTRRNCAWELIKLLNQQDAKTPVDQSVQ